MRSSFALLALLAATAHAADPSGPSNFLFADSESLATHTQLVERKDIAGVQIVYSWKSLEPSEGQYDFSRIEADLAFLEKRGKHLFVQLQDRFFEIDARHLPSYLLEEPQYGGGLTPQSDNPGEGKPEGHGWVTLQWHPAVRGRFQALLQAMGAKLDGRVFGINLPETAVDIDPKQDKTGFDCDRYFEAEQANIAFARRVFTRTHVVQYINFWPCEWENDRKYMSRFFEFAAQNRIGLGGPDIVPHRPGQMKNSYPFFNRYKGKLALVAMAVQEPTLTYRNPATKLPYTREEFVGFARDYLGVNIIFWSLSTPWLQGK